MPLNIGLVQIVEPMLTHVCFPYALGLLESYAREHLGKQSLEHPPQFLPYIFERGDLKAQIQHLSQADIVGFSIYTWNEQYTLMLAQELKAQHPHILTVFGGPQVPDHSEAYLQKHTFIDLCCHGPGEEIFTKLITRCQSLDSNSINKTLKTSLLEQPITGFSFLKNAKFHLAEMPPRLKDLDQIPSPYLKGCFDEIMSRHPDYRWVVLWETNRGCPFSCAFCDWGSLTRSKVYRFAMKRLEQEVKWFAQHKLETIYCCDANFGILPRDIELAELLAHTRQKYDYPRLVYTQTTKNASKRAFEAQQILASAQLNPTATLSLQSVNPEVLTAIQRENISQQSYRELQKAYQQADMQAYTDLLVGLPNETVQSFMRGIGQVISEGQHYELRLWNVFLLPNAPMNAPDYKKKHGISSVQIPYVSYFTSVSETPDPLEIQDMIVGTKDMPKEDWVVIRHFGWLVQVLYYSRLLQVPIMLVHELTGRPYDHIFQSFMALNLKDIENLDVHLIQGLNTFFRQHAQEVLMGSPTALAGTDWNYREPVWMPSDYFALSQLIQSGQLYAFIDSCHALLKLYLQHYSAQWGQGHIEQAMLSEAFVFSHYLFAKEWQPKTPQPTQGMYNLPAFYQAVLQGHSKPLSAL